LLRESNVCEGYGGGKRGGTENVERLKSLKGLKNANKKRPRPSEGGRIRSRGAKS